MNNKLINVKVENVKGILVTTSNRVAEELEVRHKDLIEKIDGYVEKFKRAESSALGKGVDFSEFYIPSTYKVEGNFKKYRNYLITEKGIAQLIGGYSSAVSKAFELNVAYINEFERMKNELSIHRVPRTMKEALLIALEQQEKIEQLQLENTEMKPKVLYHDKVLQSEELVPISVIAKDLGMSGKKLNLILHELGVQYKQGDTWLLYSQYQDEGYTHSKTTVYDKPDGSTGSKIHTYWTQKGRLFIYEKLKEFGIIVEGEK